MTHDTGFAPNPFFGHLTLATCKPGLRKFREKGDWIAGFGSVTLCKDPVGSERLIFLMEITKDPLPMAEYYHGYPKKRPKDSSYKEMQKQSGCGEKVFFKQFQDVTDIDYRFIVGDNIYKPLNGNSQNPDDYDRLSSSPFHNTVEDKARDISGVHVLISEYFYYFGSNNCLIIPTLLRPVVPKGISPHGKVTEGVAAQRFIDFIEGKFNNKFGMYGAPVDWHPKNDMSWCNDENYIQP